MMHLPSCMKIMMVSVFGLALATTACVGTVVVDTEDEGSGGTTQIADREVPSGSCLACVGETCGYCPESPGRVTYVCFEGTPPVTAGSCYDSGSLFSTSDGDFYTCSLCSNE